MAAKYYCRYGCAGLFSKALVGKHVWTPTWVNLFEELHAWFDACRQLWWQVEFQYFLKTFETKEKEKSTVLVPHYHNKAKVSSWCIKKMCLTLPWRIHSRCQLESPTNRKDGGLVLQEQGRLGTTAEILVLQRSQMQAQGLSGLCSVWFLVQLHLWWRSCFSEIKALKL